MFRPAGVSDRNVREALSENAELKKFHDQIRRDVQAILSRHEGVHGRGAVEESTGVNRRVGTGRARPTRNGDAGFTASLKKQWNGLKQLVESLEARAAQSEVSHVISVTDHEKELTRLKKDVQELRDELDQSRELISQQQQLLQDQMLPPPGEGQPSPLWDAYFLEEQLRLEQDLAVFEEQKMAFQDERDKFTEAAIRLGRERLQFEADQALFMKQQFLNMTPGLGTPLWKKTPPWSAFTSDTPNRTSSHHKQQFTPNRSCAARLPRGLTSADPMTPSTAELYRVLRLAPPSRSERSHTCESSSQQDTESEDSSRMWSDSLSPRSESPELQPLPQFVAPLKLSMTPYLLPANFSRGHNDPRTPSTAELFRVLRLTPAESVSSGQKRQGDELRRSILNQSHRRASLTRAAEPPCCNENARSGDHVSGCPHELAAAEYETDSLHSEESRRTLGDGDTPTSERLSLPRDSSECFDNDSLYRVTPLKDTSHLDIGEHVPDVRVDSCHCSQSAGSTGHDRTDQGVCPCEKKADKKLAKGLNPNSVLRSRPKETLQCCCRSRETLHPEDAFRSRLSERPCPRHGGRSRSRERPHSRERCRSRSRERPHSRDHHGSRYMEDVHPGNRTFDQPRAFLNFEDYCAAQKNEVPPNDNTKRRRSLESLHHKHGYKSQARESCGSRSARRRSSYHRRDSLYTSGPGRSPLHFRRSCPSAHNGGPLIAEYVTAANLCEDLLTQFLACSH
ncbi:uncharacterized protein LOC142151218 isoform X2 [Mixophyes fleayi]|uniref:uncharacterized protein LOC142151218 isoform X2 n=1 Tax=Mixophyes fleayi TaxID=3061075 RepID=UPI003F4DB5E7